MHDNPPPYYFRIRDNGALVFRTDAENRQNRLEMTPIAVANTRNGEIKPQGSTTLTKADLAAINTWLEKRRAELTERETDDIRRTIDTLSLTAHWAQTRATDAQLAEVTTDLLLAMHDLRAVLVRKATDRTGNAAGDQD